MKIPYGYLYKRAGGKRFSRDSKRAAIFYFSNPGPDGREHPVSLRTTDRETAELRAVEMCGRMKLTNEEEWLHSLVDLGQWAKERLSGATVSVEFTKVWAAYTASRRRPASGERTLKHYGVIWTQFTKWCRGCFQTLEALDAGTCERYVAHLENRLKESSIKKHLATLKLIYRVVCPDAVNPWDGLQIMKQSRTVKKRALDPDEVKRIIASSLAFEVVDKRYTERHVVSPPNIGREFAGLHLTGYWTGLRLYDAVHLCGELIDRNLWVIRIVPKKTGRRKVDPLEIPVSAELQDWFEEYAPLRGQVFPLLTALYDGTSGGRLSEYLAQIWADAAVKDDERGTASFHSLRVTFQSLNDAAGTSRVFTRAVTGHSGAKMSDTYSRQNTEAVRTAVGRALPEVLK